ncbi:hypothetical protein CFC21_106259 [Triticum aestivum]|uniref:F-box domain-containing protein n=2 Tax=Triticum aestivum TaxID=4565 RepID=A0A9R1N9E4_WHEAT|nr:hypothetical protein CFC21_106259 [Triticum aestivum]
MIRRRGGSPLEDDDMLGEILLRLPPQPSSLPRASAVCKRWRGLLTNPGFLRRFRTHHREPPLLGVFHQLEFTPVLAAPDRIPFGCLDLPTRDLWGRLLDCRHGRVLILHRFRPEVLVCDPIMGDQQCVPIPPEFKRGYLNGTVLCAACDKGHVHGGCHSTPFKVVLLLSNDRRPLTSVYSSETGTWGGLISTEVPCLYSCNGYISTLVGNVLYWSFMYAKMCILGFDLERQSIDVIKGPPGMNRTHSHRIIQAEDGTVAIVMLSYRYQNIQIWHMKVNCHGVSTWVLWKTIETDNILGLPTQVGGEQELLKYILGYVEDTDGIFLDVNDSIYMVQLNSLQSRKLCETRDITSYHSFRSFYAAGDCSSQILIL